MDFQEAENRFRWLGEQLRSGRLTEAQYRAALAELRVVDAAGRTWMQQEISGIWHVYHGGQWQAAQPPRPAAPPPPAIPQYQPQVQPQYPPQVQPVQPAAVSAAPRSGSVGGKYLKYFLIWLVAWLVIGGGLFLFVAQDEPDVMYGVAVAAVLSLVLMLFSLGSQWQGQVLKIYTVEESSGDDSTRTVTYAEIRMPNGKTRREPAMNDWQVGDWLVKRQGETYPQKGPRF